MTDGQTLFAVFTAFYLIECLWLNHARAWLAAGTGGTGWRFLRPFGRFQISGGAPTLLTPLPPFVAHLYSLEWLFIPRDEGLAIAQTDGTHTLIAWEKLHPRVEATTLHLDAVSSARLPTAAAATTWQQTLTEWKALTPEKRRRAFLKHARQSLDPAQAEKLAATATQHTRATRILGSVLFFWCFATITIVYQRLGESTATFAVLAALPVLTLTQAILFLRITRQHALSIPHRRWRALGMVFLPHQAMRAADFISLAHTHHPHPLAFRALISNTAFFTAARTFWRTARYHPGWQTSPDLTPEAEALETFFRAQDIPATDYDPAPELSHGATAWCPRCHAPFLTPEKPCTDCGGVELRVKPESPCTTQASS